MDSNLTRTAKTTPVFENSPQTESQLCLQVIHTNQDWEVRRIIGEDFDGVPLYVPDNVAWALNETCKGASGIRSRRDFEHSTASRMGTVFGAT